MTLVTMKELFKGLEGKRAIGAFNVHNLEFINGVILGAEKQNRSIIMMINEAVLKYGKIEVLGQSCLNSARNSTVDIAVMVDHGEDVEFLKSCIDSGLDVMFDGSKKPFDENVKYTKELSDYAHKRGQSIEGEIGSLGLSEDGDEK